jgi:RNA polymerase sigma-70 factor (ECF subfamily)
MQSFESDRSTASPEDADLQEDFDDIYRTTAPMVYAFCLRILRDADDAADAVQQTYVNAWQARESFRGESRMTTWLLTIARRMAYRVMRDRRRRPDTEIPAELADTQSHQPDRVALEQAVSALPNRMRLAVTLFYVHDRSIAETAQIMGIAVGTVKAHLDTARRRLRRSLG